MSETSVKIIKNEVGCRDDTVPKTVETRRHCEEDLEHATIFRNTLPTSLFLGVAEHCCMLSLLLAVPSCFNSFWHGVIPTSYFIFNDFYTLVYKGMRARVVWQGTWSHVLRRFREDGCYKVALLA